MTINILDDLDYLFEEKLIQGSWKDEKWRKSLKPGMIIGGVLGGGIAAMTGAAPIAVAGAAALGAGRSLLSSAISQKIRRRDPELETQKVQLQKNRDEISRLSQQLQSRAQLNAG